ncbi:GNAT family N-acetyltransferase [Laribacter hongkongensis]|uniref:GNAT family N-acetyltransferase n=1 Tax=Laribacter hongkongensis TaxID=168471 RepID=UPI001EFCC7D9|nr:GNAT family N-acetyltransferase [Laribacter hongkongensis]MCG9021832.1 GNAT family N-acetyltransferase [Laribacter hongkongensis]
MSQSSKASSLLKPKHFDGLDTSLTDQGLRFSTRIGPTERQDEIFEIADGDYEVENKLEEIQHLRPYTKITANPRRLSARSLLKVFRDAQERLFPDESISLTHGLPDKYELRWDRQRKSASDDVEGQSIVLVAMDGDDLVGFAGLGIRLLHDAERKQIDIYHSLNLVYVHPAHRGQGFGIDLSIACGYLCRDVFSAIYRAAPADYTIVPIIKADLESKGGERFTQQVSDALDFQADMLRMDGKRKSITVESTCLDAGY